MHGVIKRNNITMSTAKKNVIIFAHGLGCDQNVWRKVTPAFESHYQVILFDYVGSGLSDKSAYSTERYQTLHGYAQDVIEICEELHLEEITFVGHSVSGMVGALASIARPNLIKNLIMIGASPRYINDTEYIGGFEGDDIEELLDMMELNYKEWAKYLAPIATRNEEHPDFTVEFESQLLDNDPVIMRQFAEVTFLSDHREILKEIEAQTLILQTGEDAIAPLEVTYYLNKHIRNSELSIMTEAKGHNPHITNPELITEEIMSFIERKK